VSPEKLLPSRRRGLFDAPDRIGSPRQLELDGREAVLDGEIVALDNRGIPSFSRLQQRMHVQRPASLLRTQVPVTYYDFDVLDIDRTGITDLPYIERREALSNLSMDHDRIKVPILD
jgi:bifunctional non-homologous end joining protein LigD